MDKSYNEVYEKIKRYKLTKFQRAIIFQQINDVLGQMDYEDITKEGTIDDFINDIFEYNDIEKKIKKDNVKIPKIVISIFLIIAGIGVMFSQISIQSFLIVFFLLLALITLIKKNFFLAAIFALILASIIFGEMTFEICIGIILIAIGLSRLFSGSKKYEKINMRKYHKEHIARHKEYMKMHGKIKSEVVDEKIKSKYREKLKKIEESINEDINKDPKQFNMENEILYINNTFNGATYKLVDESINYIELNNRFGGCKLELNHFKFQENKLIININNSFGGLDIVVNENTKVQNLISSKFGGVGYTNDIIKPSMDKKYIVYIQGENKLGGINIIYD